MRNFLLAALVATPAWADCPGEVIFSCKIKAKVLEVCLTDEAVRYSFGKPGKPELTLRSPLAEVDYIPGSVFGHATILDSLRFYNAGVTYDVWAIRNQLVSPAYPETPRRGGVSVTKGDAVLADLNCNAAPNPSALQTVYPAKQALGQCWSIEKQIWAKCS